MTNSSLFVDLILYVTSTIFQLCRRVFLGLTSTKLGLMCLAQGQNAVTPVRLEPVAPRSRVKHSSTKPLRSLTNGSLTKVESIAECSPWSILQYF